MPRTLKRRSDAISRDSPPPAQDSSPEREANTNNRRRRPSTSSDSAASNDGENDNISEAEDDGPTQAATHQRTLVKKLVRLALATEYSRQPLRRNDISQKVFKDSGSSGRSFKTVFAEAQKVLGGVFGMRLVELPGREKVGLKDRRAAAQASQAAKKKGKETQGGEGGAGGGSSSKSWILVSVLPEGYRTHPEINVPARAPTVEMEAGYTALYSFVVAIVWLNGNELSEGKMERYMQKVNVGGSTEWGSWEKVLARMVREGYVDRRKEQEEGWVYSVGPRGKVEVGTRGVEGLVKAVYGVGAGQGEGGEEERDEGEEDGASARTNGKLDEDELNRRLARSLGVSVGGQTQEVQMVNGGGEEDNGEQPEPQQRRRSGRRRGARDDDDDDDE